MTRARSNRWGPRFDVPLAPAHWEAELIHVVWMAVRAGVLSAAEAPVRLGLARRLGIESIATATLCQGALAFSSDVDREVQVVLLGKTFPASPRVLPPCC